MARIAAWVLSAALHLGVPLAIAWAGTLGVPDLPPVAVRRIICIFPIADFNPLSLLQGASALEVARFLGAEEARTRVADGCVRYRYAAGEEFILRYRHGVVERLWSASEGSLPAACGSRARGTVTIPARQAHAP